jgi:hypothetical protein
MSLSVCLVDRPSPFRAELKSALEERGNRVQLWDDPFAALASTEALAADIVAVGDGDDVTAASLLRVLERRGPSARLYRITSDGSAAPLPTRSRRVPRSFGAAAVAAALLRDAGASDESFSCDVAGQQLGQLLIWLRDRRATGVLVLQAEGYERELSLIMGMPVHARSTQPGERLGALALKHGLIQPRQLDAALVQARAGSTALGRALIDLGFIDASVLFGLLAQQLREQVEAACAGGPYKARFRPDHGIAAQSDLYPLHPMTALLGAAQRVAASVVSPALERAASRTIVERASSPAIVSWLRAIGVELDLKATTLGALCTSLAEQGAGAEGKPSTDSLIIALLGAGMRLGEAPRAPGAAPSLPPPVGASLLRVLETRAAFKPPVAHAPTLEAPEEELQRALQAALGSAEAQPAAPEAETISPALRALYVVHKSCRDPFEVIGVPHAARQAEIDLAYCARLEALDEACEESTGATVALRKLELRRAFDRAHAVLTQKNAAEIEVHKSEVQVGRASSAMIEAPSKSAITALEPAVAAELEPLVRKASWYEVIAWMEEKYPGGTSLPPGLALLYAIALKEAPTDVARTPMAAQADRLGIRAVSELLGVGDDTAIALVVAKRTLRKRQLEWQKEPPKRVSITLMLIALVIGAAVGLAMSRQPIPLPW